MIKQSCNVLLAIFTHGYPSQIEGGPNNIIYKLLKGYRGEDYKFSYISRDIKPHDVGNEDIDDLYNKMPLKKKISSRLFKKSKIFESIVTSNIYLPFHYSKITSYFSSFKSKIAEYEIIHSHDSIVQSLILPTKTTAQKILTIHSKGALSNEITNSISNEEIRRYIHSKLNPLEVESVSKADIITFPSKAAKEYFIESIGMPISSEKTNIIYNGIDYNCIVNHVANKDVFQKYDIETDGNCLFFLNVASHVREKKINVLLNVISILRFTYNLNVKLINIGIGNLTSELKQLSKQLGISQYVYFVGQVPNLDVLSFMKLCDIFIMTSEKVIFDIVVLEAMACGACVMVSDEGGNREIIIDGINGYLIDNNIPEIIAKKVLSINKMRVKEVAIKTVKQYSIESMVKQYIQLYNGIR